MTETNFLTEFVINFLKAHPWVCWSFLIGAFFVNFLRVLYPNSKKRPKAVYAVLHIFDAFAFNFWGPLRILSDIANKNKNPRRKPKTTKQKKKKEPQP